MLPGFGSFTELEFTVGVLVMVWLGILVGSVMPTVMFTVKLPPPLARFPIGQVTVNATVHPALSEI